MRVPILLAILLFALPVGAQPPPQIVLPGQARTGADARAVRFIFYCSENSRNATGVLGLELHVPRFTELASVFDFDAFEGPDAQAGARTRIEAGGASGRFAVSGWIGVTDDRPFAFGLSAPRRRDPQRLATLARVLAPVTTGAAQLVWTQRDAGRSGSSIVARLDVSAEDSARLRELLGPCLQR